MKQAILITAYKHFNHLLDILHCFDERFEFYIHIDKKAVINDKILFNIELLSNVRVISRKYKVRWGSRNHLKAILHLCEIAFKNKEISTFHLITGQDFPVKLSDYFVDFFKQQPNTNYINYHELPSANWKEGGLNRLIYYNLYDVLDAKKYRGYIFKFVELQKKNMG